MSHPPYPPDRAPQERKPSRPDVDGAALLGGGVLGFIAAWALITITIFALLASYGTSTTKTQEVVAIAVLVSPAVIAVALLLFARTRYWGAGMLIGFAIGYIVGSGVCVGFGVLGG